MNQSRWVFPLACLIATQSALAAPIVALIPGAGSSGDRIWLNNLNWALPLLGGDLYFGKLRKDLAKRGLNTFVCPGEADRDSRTLEKRAENCVSQILRRQGRCSAGSPREVLLMGHSMGGLIARLLARDPRVQDCIHSVTTISTPHQGTPFADWAIERAQADDNGFDILGKLVKLIQFEPEHVHYLPQLRTDRTGADPGIFRAQDIEDHPLIPYYSITTSMRLIPVAPLAITRGILASEIKKRGLDQTSYGTKNDGIVPEYSMEHGHVLGHLNVYHWASACVDPSKHSRECKVASTFLVGHLAGIWPGP